MNRGNGELKIIWGGYFSVVTPVFNRADCIGRCIESVIRNLHYQEKLEHIIVDDGSTDETARIVLDYAEKYPHIKFVSLQGNYGPNAARNAAIKEAEGDFCIILDSDDYFVDNAILTIRTVIQRHPHYRHYLFAPDDMQSEYAENDLLKGYHEKVLLYGDFLSGRISYDYIHVIDTRIMKQYPFDEFLRIYEGVFFLKFYREAKSILFTNEIIVIRERRRTDSATKETFRTSHNAIERAIKAAELYITWFKMDYEQLGLQPVLFRHYQRLIDCLLMLSRYSDCKKYMNSLIENGGYVSARHKILYRMRIGWLYRVVIKYYVYFKYKIHNAIL